MLSDVADCWVFLSGQGSEASGFWTWLPSTLRNSTRAMYDFNKTRVACTVSVAPILESRTLSPCQDSSLALLNRLYLYGYESIAVPSGILQGPTTQTQALNPETRCRHGPGKSAPSCRTGRSGRRRCRQGANLPTLRARCHPVLCRDARGQSLMCASTQQCFCTDLQALLSSGNPS